MDAGVGMLEIRRSRSLTNIGSSGSSDEGSLTNSTGLPLGSVQTRVAFAFVLADMTMLNVMVSSFVSSPSRMLPVMASFRFIWSIAFLALITPHPDW